MNVLFLNSGENTFGELDLLLPSSFPPSLDTENSHCVPFAVLCCAFVLLCMNLFCFYFAFALHLLCFCFAFALLLFLPSTASYRHTLRHTQRQREREREREIERDAEICAVHACVSSLPFPLKTSVTPRALRQSALPHQKEQKEEFHPLTQKVTEA